MTNKNSYAAQNRFIYFPDHLVRMPGPGMSFLSNIRNVFSESIFNGTISGAFSEVTKPKRSPELLDESIGVFLSRRFGSALADNIASAVFHGIYAGDIYKLSARTILPGLWEIERKHQSVIAGMLQAPFGGYMPINTADLKMIKELQRQPEISGSLAAVKKSSVFTFKGGLGELAERLESKLLKNPKVVIHKQKQAQNVRLHSTGEGPKTGITLMDFKTKTSRSSDFSHVISTIAGDKLSGIIESNNDSFTNTLGFNKSVTVMVVNFFFRNPRILPVHGFGYLLPRTVPFDQNPERALGVIFDTDASIGQDDVEGTKITVMLGGHWWDDFEDYPDEAEGAGMARAVLKRHLGIDAEPRTTRVSLQRNCIPQYAVGHDERMETAHWALTKWEGRLRVAGNSYTGVGLNDCVRAARDVVKGLVDGTGRTGLDHYVGGRTWSWVDPNDLQMQKSSDAVTTAPKV